MRFNLKSLHVTLNETGRDDLSFCVCCFFLNCHFLHFHGTRSCLLSRATAKNYHEKFRIMSTDANNHKLMEGGQSPSLQVTFRVLSPNFIRKRTAWPQFCESVHTWWKMVPVLKWHISIKWTCAPLKCFKHSSNLHPHETSKPLVLHLFQIPTYGKIFKSWNTRRIFFSKYTVVALFETNDKFLKLKKI